MHWFNEWEELITQTTKAINILLVQGRRVKVTLDEDDIPKYVEYIWTDAEAEKQYERAIDLLAYIRQQMQKELERRKQNGST